MQPAWRSPVSLAGGPIRLFGLRIDLRVCTRCSTRLSQRTLSSHMAFLDPNAQYDSYLYSPHGTNTSSTSHLEMETVELASLDDRFGSASGSLLRRGSVTSIASVTSSLAKAQRYGTIKRIFQAISECTARLDSRVQGRMRRSRFYGWRMGLVFGSTMSAFVLCCNITATIVASRLGTKRSGNILDIMSGDGVAISRWSTIFHIIINVFSTILLAASNYTVQVLCSPTRSDLDSMHAKGLWLDVGLLSLRNLWYLPRGRIALGLLLGFSSIPLHLL
jgi:hypothetical protein